MPPLLSHITAHDLLKLWLHRYCIFSIFSIDVYTIYSVSLHWSTAVGRVLDLVGAFTTR